MINYGKAAVTLPGTYGDSSDVMRNLLTLGNSLPSSTLILTYLGTELVIISFNLTTLQRA